jgi:hypothetical protein
MKLRIDLLEHLTAEDLMEEVMANNHRYNPERLLAKTGIGSLRPANAEEREKELERCVELTRRLEERARKRCDAGTLPTA